MKYIRFFEYSGFLKSDGAISDQLSECPITKDEINALRNISDTVLPGKEVFNIGSSNIRANSLVGIISLGNLQIEILPKLIRNRFKESNETSESTIIKNLMYMLSYTNALDVEDTGIGTLAERNDSFIEAYISIFANRLARHLIRYGTPKTYVEKSENINAIRGKISFHLQRTQNMFNESKVYCDFSEFSEDNDVSKAFKYVANVLAKLTRNQSSLGTLSKCFGLLDGVSPQYISPDTLGRASMGKRDSNFLALVSLAQMFLRKLRPDFSGNRKNKVFALLFDMNELFEEFIFQVLKRHEKDLDILVNAQKRRRLVCAERNLKESGEWVTKNLFDTYTDISIKKKNGDSFIIDTKYKIVNSEKSHYGISNQDAYQILAYRQIHQNVNDEPTVALLYPKTTFDLHKEFRVNGESTVTFRAWTIDISRDLRSNLGHLVEDLRQLIDDQTYHEKSGSQGVAG